jgi:hypothetical protein
MPQDGVRVARMAKRRTKKVHDLKKDEVLAEALARGQTRIGAARHANISLRTVHNRLKDPSFLALLRSYRKEFIDSAYGELASGLPAVVQRMKLLVDSEDQRIALAASKAYGALTVKLGMFHDHEERLALVEEAARKKGDL